VSCGCATGRAARAEPRSHTCRFSYPAPVTVVRSPGTTVAGLAHIYRTSHRMPWCRQIHMEPILRPSPATAKRVAFVGGLRDAETPLHAALRSRSRHHAVASRRFVKTSRVPRRERGAFAFLNPMRIQWCRSEVCLSHEDKSRLSVLPSLTGSIANRMRSGLHNALFL